MGMYGPPRTKFSSDLPSLTQQNFKKSVDINYLVGKYKRMGGIPPASRPGQFLDLSVVGDFRSALETVKRGEAAFSSLPSSLRRRFNNDASEYVAFVMDSKNRDEALALGLIETPAGAAASAAAPRGSGKPPKGGAPVPKEVSSAGSDEA